VQHIEDLYYGADHKGRPHSEERACSVRTFYRQGGGPRGFFRCAHLHFLVQKTRNFWNLCCVCTDKGGGSWASV